MNYFDIKQNGMKEFLQNRKPRNGPPGKHIWSIILIALAISLLGDLIAGIPTLYLCRYVDDPGWRFLLENYLVFIGSFGLMILYLYSYDRELFNTILPANHRGLKGNTLKQLALGFLAGMALNGLCALIAALHGDLKFSIGRFDIVYMVVALILVAIQSSCEELILRGYVFQAINRKFALIQAIVWNSIVFALLHMGNNGIGPLPIIDLLVWSVACSLVLYYFDSLWFIMMAHTAWNYTQNFLLGLPNSGLVSERSFLHLEAASDSIFYDFSFGLEGGIISTLEFVIISAAIILCARKRKPNIIE